jgi:hypothetical protein
MEFHRLFASLCTLTLAVAMIPASLNAQNTPPSETNSASDNNSHSQVLVDPGMIYNDKNPGNWVGKSVTLKNVMVQDTNNSGNFWVGSDSSHRLLVVRSDDNPNIKAMRFHKGDVVTIEGTIQPASKYEASKTGAEKGSMHDAEKSSGIFLMANNISIASSTQH